MATADSVKANLQSIIAKANSVTGRTDSNVGAAVDALISGFGTGSGGITPTETKTVVRTVTLDSDVTGTGATYTLLSADEFIKEHYADEGFSVALIPVTPAASATGVIHFNYQGNRNIGSTTKTLTGVGLRSSSASAVGVVTHNTAINGKGYSQHMRVNSSGDLQQYLYTGYILKAGTYQIILTCTAE